MRFKRELKQRGQLFPLLPIPFLAVVLLALFCGRSHADTTYITPDDFVHDIFSDQQSSELPKAEFLWLDNAAQVKLTQALGHPYPQARLHYWRSPQKDRQKTVWILDEIGKEYPITAGFVVVDQHIERAQVLIYRESRGIEIHLPVFLAQFVNAHLNSDQLSNKIDGITGATLSVDAMKRMARAALILNALTLEQNTP